MVEATEITESSNEEEWHPLTKRANKILRELQELDLSLKAIGRAVGKSDRTLRNILSGTKPGEPLVNALEMYLKHQKQWYANFRNPEVESVRKAQEDGVSYTSSHQVKKLLEEAIPLLQTLVKDRNKKEEQGKPKGPKAKKRTRRKVIVNYPNSHGIHEPSPSTDYPRKKKSKSGD